MLRTLLPAVLAALLLAPVALAQGVTTAALNGRVLDATGESLPGANVGAGHQPTGTEYGTTTRTDGRYNLPNVQVGGPYIVTVSFVGFQSQQETGITLDVLNVGNLLNNEWGRVRTVGRTHTLIELASNPINEDGQYVVTGVNTRTVSTPDNILSRWQMQLGFRYSF